MAAVITSYSIHYTKLYDLADQVDLLQGLGLVHPELDLDRVGVVQQLDQP